MSDLKRYALVIFDDEETPEIVVYEDLAQIVGEIEPPEALDGAYGIFDEAGRRAVLSADEKSWNVVVDRWEDDEADQLRLAISSRFRGQDLGIEPTEASISDLLEIIAVQIGVGRQTTSGVISMARRLRRLLSRPSE